MAKQREETYYVVEADASMKATMKTEAEAREIRDTLNLPLRDDPHHPGKHLDPYTGIWPISEWGPECRRGPNKIA